MDSKKKGAKKKNRLFFFFPFFFRLIFTLVFKGFPSICRKLLLSIIEHCSQNLSFIFILFFLLLFLSLRAVPFFRILFGVVLCVHSSRKR